MGISTIIFIAIIALIIATLPMWNYSKMWGRSYTPGIFLGFILAAHTYTVVFGK